MLNLQKKLLSVFLVFVTIKVLGQSQSDQPDLDKLFKLKVGYYTAGLGYEFPLGERIAIELSSGVSSGYQIDPTLFGINMLFGQLTPVFYARDALKYYYKPRKPADGLNTLGKNEGKYFAFQNKFTSGGVRKEVYATPTILNELHWGNQRTIIGDLIFNYHFGLGHAYNFSDKIGAIYPSIGINLSYILLSRE